MQTGTTFDSALRQFFAARQLHKKPKTIAIYRDVERLIRAGWPDASVGVEAITADMVLQLAAAFDGQCVTRWNNMVAALRWITPEARLLKRRPVKLRAFVPPGQMEFEGFLARCDGIGRGSHVGLVVRFLCFTGMRQGESRAVQWADVTDQVIHVRGEAAKGGRGRAVPILPDLRPVLVRLSALSRDAATGAEFVLPRENCRRALRSASAAAFGKQWSPHLCRHFFATRCIGAGVDLPTVARWLGHADGGALLAKTYFHLADAHSLAMADRVRFTTAAAVGGVQGEPCAEF